MSGAHVPQLAASVLGDASLYATELIGDHLWEYNPPNTIFGTVSTTNHNQACGVLDATQSHEPPLGSFCRPLHTFRMQRLTLAVINTTATRQ